MKREDVLIKATRSFSHDLSNTKNNNNNKKNNNNTEQRAQQKQMRRAQTTTGKTTTRIRSSFSTVSRTNATILNENMYELREEVEKSRIISSPSELDQRRVLVLDVAMQTSNIVSWQKALILAMFDKVDVLEYYEEMVASAYSAFYLPAVVKTRVYDKQKGSIALSRKNVLIRDHHSCTYCGARDDLTIDHIVPASKGGEWSWTNLTTACAKCNNRKGDKMLKQCSGMKLVRPAKEPCVASGEFSQFSRIVNPPDEWIPFIDPRHVKRIPDGFMDDLQFGDVSIKNNVVDVEKTLLKVTSKNYKKKKSKSSSSSSSPSSSSSSTR
jgi:5-methylcytosine-specific restriction endonuclease McrA